MTRDVSVIVAARNEEWLGHTVRDVLVHTSDATEIIVVLDGAWPAEPLPQDARLQVVYVPTSIGQRAAVNLGARLSTARYIAKLDAHCAVAPGFDVALITAAATLGDDVTQIPAQKNLHVYDWACACGWRQDHGHQPERCPACGGVTVREVIWKPRRGSTTTSWVFDATPHFQYDKTGQAAQQGDLCDVMTSLGACFFMARERFWRLGGLDESHGSWGSFGIEIACKSWLSGGRHVVNRRTWFAHFFRVGGLGFPYPIHASDQERARQRARSLWFTNAWTGQVRPLRWLVEKFWPVKGWTEEQRDALGTLDEPTVALAAHDRPLPDRVLASLLHEREAIGVAPLVERSDPASGTVREPALHLAVPDRRDAGVVYYTDRRVSEEIGASVCARIAAVGLPTVAVTCEGLTLPVDWLPKAHRIALPDRRGYLAMFKQILAGLEALDTTYACLVEHDVWYADDHFAFRPPRDDRYYYNVSTWKLDVATGRAVFYRCKQTSGLCASRELLIAHYRERIRRVEQHGFSRRMGFEPGSHRRAERIDDVPAEEWRSAVPNIDLRHGQNLTPSRWSPSEFRDPRNCQEWTEARVIPGWGDTSELVARLRPLVEVA